MEKRRHFRTCVLDGPAGELEGFDGEDGRVAVDGRERVDEHGGEEEVVVGEAAEGRGEGLWVGGGRGCVAGCEDGETTGEGLGD